MCFRLKLQVTEELNNLIFFNLLLNDKNLVLSSGSEHVQNVI